MSDRNTFSSCPPLRSSFLVSISLLCPQIVCRTPYTTYTRIQTGIVVPPITPTSTPILPTSPSGPEIVLFVGYPALGKTTFFRKHFEEAGYVHVNQDTLRTRHKCVKAVEEAIEEQKSCVVGRSHPLYKPSFTGLTKDV